MTRLTQPQAADDWHRARRLVEEYVASLPLDLSFQQVNEELSHLASEYGAPTGVLLVAEETGTDVGCIGLRKWDRDVGEVKRLYVRPAARGHGVGRLLVDEIIVAAGRLGYGRLRLDTLPDMKAALALYESRGFKRIAPYRFNPAPDAVYLELILGGGT